MSVSQFVSIKQECIPVGCVLSAAVAVSRWGGVPGPGGGGCTWSQWGCTWSGGVHLVPGGVPGPGGVSAPRGVYLVRYSPPCGQTHACKNITFATSLRTVMKKNKSNMIDYLMTLHIILKKVTSIVPQNCNKKVEI